MVENFEMSDSKTPEFLKMNPVGKVLVLKTLDGHVFESNVIALYVARLKASNPLLDSSPIDYAHIEQWIDFSSLEIDAYILGWLMPVVYIFLLKKTIVEQMHFKYYRDQFPMGDSFATLGGRREKLSCQTVSGQTQGNETVRAPRTDGSAHGQTGNQTQTGQPFLGHPFPQVMQIPIHSPIPDALRTLFEFMACLDQYLAQDGSQPNNSPNSMRDMPRRVELPSSVWRLHVLSIVLRQAHRLLGDLAVATLCHVAGRLEQEGAFSDPSTRGQIQAESSYVGIAMQYLGALFLELGRTMLTLQIGNPPVGFLVIFPEC